MSIAVILAQERGCTVRAKEAFMLLGAQPMGLLVPNYHVRIAEAFATNRTLVGTHFLLVVEI